MRYLRLREVAMMFCITLAILFLIIAPQIKKYPAVPFGGGGGSAVQFFDPIGWAGQKLSEFIDWLTPSCCPSLGGPSTSDGFGGGGGSGF